MIMDQAHHHQHPQQRPSQLTPTGEIRIAMGDLNEDGKNGNEKATESAEEDGGSPTAAAGEASKKKDHLRDSNDEAKKNASSSGGVKTPPSATGDGKQNLLSVQP